MSTDLLEQLVEYGADHRARQAPVERHEILARVGELVHADDRDERTVPRRRGTRRPRRWSAVTVAAAAIAALGLTGLVIVSNRTPTEETQSAETPATAPSSADLAAPVSGETQQTIIGDITWTLVEGDGATQPERVFAEIDGEFFGTEESGRTWRSFDGITWEQTDPLTDDGLEVVELDGETWATVFSPEDGSQLLRRDGTEFVPVPLPETLAPAADGLQRLGPMLERPIVVGGELLIAATTYLEVPWDDLYSTDRLFPEWDAVTETIRLRDPTSSDPLPIAVVTAELTTGEGAGVVFRDADTGAVVTTVGLIPGLDPDDFFNRIVDGGFAHNELYVGGADGFEVIETPWPQTTAPRFAVLDDRLLAVVEHIRLDDPGSGRHEWELSASVDRRSWESLELPTPFGSQIDEITIVGDGSLALLTIVSSDASAQRAETWSTRNGVAWSPVEGAAGFGGIDITDVGWVRFEFEERSGISVSPDGLTWQHIATTLGQPQGPGNGDGSVHGDTIFLTMNENGGQRTMWVGRVDNARS